MTNGTDVVHWHQTNELYHGSISIQIRVCLSFVIILVEMKL